MVPVIKEFSDLGVNSEVVCDLPLGGAVDSLEITVGSWLSSEEIDNLGKLIAFVCCVNCFQALVVYVAQVVAVSAMQGAPNLFPQCRDKLWGDLSKRELEKVSRMWKICDSR